ncbi:FAD:protein FMN transferase [Shewanella eurypsychrophilus]|uniref:FAD:protein FMN transferase n=1 Tax=Shewanella eurypsychrophilus TaxID=2593656 RepID=A0ABX6V304_9GAMM|nr:MULTISPECIES: FAD:protein FMN transferase [Shewanella]QFU21720.1 FAD:protein FMN transferase ApbE [Shewanella sp. YLB-09]QPG57010.1 FAD:protein FMN transferase [Shewanella eurypsychrophilus]
MKKTLVNWLALVWLAFFVSGCSQPAPIISLSGNTMGTTYHIKVVPSAKLPEANLLQAEIDIALEKVNDQMSTYRPDSELSRFNSMGHEETITVSKDTAFVIAEGIHLYEVTGGALDITLGPLVNLWGFGPDKRPTELPSEDVIAAAKAKTGIEFLHLDGMKLSKTNPDLYVDLSSIAKGFGVDMVASILDKYHVSGYLVEIGGELSVYGNKMDDSPWRVAIEQPDVDDREIQLVFAPGDNAIATSGDYRNYYEEDGRQFSHLIDPRDGYPIDHRLASVTVLHKQSMVADGYATAMMVLGTEKSLALAKQENLAIMLIEKQDDGFNVFYSDAFKPYVNQ